MNTKTLKFIANNFSKELTDANSDKITSLPFIIHELSKSPLAADNESFQVLKIGGSIMQNALVHKEGSDIIVDSIEEERLPIFTTGKAFLAFIKSHLRKNIRILALNFAYPLKPVFENGKLDGILVNGTKEHSFTGLVGKQIGNAIEEHIQSIFRKYVSVSLANDTICLVLAGLTKHKAQKLAGGIVGTGLNFAFFLDDQHLVNLEAANFDKLTLSPEAHLIDDRSLTQKRSLFEKETAGGYLYLHYNLTIARTNPLFHPVVSTHGLDKVARGEVPGDKKLARSLFERSAQLVACEIAGIANYKKCDMTFIMEGSLFWIGYNFRSTVEKTVKLLAPNYKVAFEEIKDCGIIGAAKLVT